MARAGWNRRGGQRLPEVVAWYSVRVKRFAFLLLAPLAFACSKDEGTPTPPTPDAGGPLAMDVGEVVELTLDGAGAGGEHIATPTGSEKFVLVLASTKMVVQGTEATYAIATDAVPDGATSNRVTGCSITPFSGAPPAETAPAGTAPAIGTTKKIQVSTGIGSETIDAKVIATGATAVVWADVTAAHPAVLDDGFVQQFLADFEAIVMPRERSVFGVESDLDKDGHVQLVFSPLTHDTAVAFFTGCDLKSDLAGCTTYNGGEYLYLTPPNAIDPPYDTPAAIKEILAHEASHMIHFNRKVLRNDSTKWTDSGYMIEGIGGFAQDVIGYQAGNLYVTMAGLDGLSQFSLADTLVDNRNYDTKRDGVLRGGSYLFVRWLFDRAGGDAINPDGSLVAKGGTAFLRAALDASPSVAQALPSVTKATVADIATDFYTTLAISNRDAIGGVAPKNPCFAYLPTVTDPLTKDQRGANVYAKFHGMQMNGPPIAQLAKADGKIRVGGVEYVEVDATPGSPSLDLGVTIDPAIAPRVRVARIK